MSGVSNLVQDARLETSFHSQYLYHVYHDSDPLAGHRSILRREYWERRKHLGAGGFGSVWLEECVKGQQKGEMRAVKEIKRPQTLIDYNRELEALFKFSHARYARCFVKLLGWYDDEANLYIAMDYFPLGNLESYLRNSSTPLPIVEVQQITFQLLEGVAFMHKNKFAHRDLKPANIVIQSQPPRTWWVKISDFGISKYSHDSQAASSNKGGTTAYMAPERQGYSAQGHETSRNYPNAADMWALGEIAHTLLTKRHVFPTPYDLFQFTEKEVEFPCVHLRDLNVDAVASSFILAVMVAAPENRLTAEEAQYHQWMMALVPSSPSLEAPSFPSTAVPLHALPPAESANPHTATSMKSPRGLGQSMTMANIPSLTEHIIEHLEPTIGTPSRNGTSTTQTVIVYKQQAVVRSTSCPPNVAASTQTRHTDVQFAPQSLLPTEKDMQLGSMIQTSSSAHGQDESRARATSQKEIGLTTPTFGQPSMQQTASTSRQQDVARNTRHSNNGDLGTQTRHTERTQVVAPTCRQPNSQHLATVSRQYDLARGTRELTSMALTIPSQPEKDGQEIVTAFRQGDTQQAATTFEGQNATSTTTHFKNIGNTESVKIASDTTQSANTYSYGHIHPARFVKAATPIIEPAGEQTKANFREKDAARDTRHSTSVFSEGQARYKKPESIAFPAHARSSNHFLAPQLPNNAPIPPRARLVHTNPFKRSLNGRRQPANFPTHANEPWPSQPLPSQVLSTATIPNDERLVGIDTLEDSQGRNRKLIRVHSHVSDANQLPTPHGSVTAPVLSQELPVRTYLQHDSYLQFHKKQLFDLDLPAYASDPSQIQSTQTFNAAPIPRQDPPVQNNYPNINQSQNSLLISFARPAYDSRLNPIQTPHTVNPAPIIGQDPALQTIFHEDIPEINAHNSSLLFKYRIEPRLLFVCPDNELNKEATSAAVLRSDQDTHLTLSSNGTIFRPVSSWQKSLFELWSVKEQRIQAYFQKGLEGAYSFTCMAFDSTGSILATGDEIGCITVWGINGRVRQRIPQSSGVNSLAISANGRWLAVNLQGMVKLSDMANNSSKVIHSSSAAGRTKTNFAFSPNGNLLALVSSSNPASIKLDLIDLGGLERIWRTNFVIRPDNRPPCLAFSPDGMRIALAAKNYILFIEVAPPRVTYKVKGAVRGLIFSRDSRYLLGSGKQDNILVWEWTTGRSRNLFTGLSFYSDVAVSPDNCLIGIGKVSVVGSGYEGKFIHELASATDIEALFDDQFAKGMIPSNPQPGKEYLLRPNLYAFYEEKGVLASSSRVVVAPSKCTGM